MKTILQSQEQLTIKTSFLECVNKSVLYNNIIFIINFLLLRVVILLVRCGKKYSIIILMTGKIFIVFLIVNIINLVLLL